ncbi:MAG TPA: tetratricopeptide repeat protein, partial [Terriglobales bacterium]
MGRALIKLGLAMAACSVAIFARAACPPPKIFEAKLSAGADADTYADLGIWFSDHRQYACAAFAFRSGLTLEPASPRLSYLLGLSLLNSGDVDAAIKPLQESVHLKPDVLKPHLLLADALEHLRRSDDARQEWVTALRIDAHSAMALDGLSRNLMAQGDYVSVIRLLGTSPREESLKIDLAMAYQRGDMTDQAEELLRKALLATPASKPLTTALVTLLITQAHFEEAAKLAKRSVALHPNDLDPQKLYLHVLVLNDDVEVARPLAAKLLKAAPHDFATLYLNGVLEREEGEFAAARTHLEEAVKLNPDHYNSRYNLGVAMEQLNDPKSAREQLEKALALGASEPQIRFEYAKVLRVLGETQLASEQLKLYQQEEKAKADRTLVASKSSQAEKEMAAGDPQKAVALYRDAVAISPDNAMLQLKLGLALDRTGDATGELDVLQKAIQLDPHMAIAHNQIGYLASQSGDYPAAEEHFRKAVTAAPAYVEAWVSLAATLGMEHRYPEAQKALE